jgi:hypothetical protein
LSSSTLLEDLNNDQIIGPFKPKVRVVANDLAFFVLRDNLTSQALRLSNFVA